MNAEVQTWSAMARSGVVPSDPAYDVWVNPPLPLRDAPPLQDFAPDEDPQFVADIERLCRAVEAAPPTTLSILLDYPAVAAGVERTRIVRAAVTRAALCGLVLPIILVRFTKAPATVPRGVASEILPEIARITVRDDVAVGHLPGLLLHELQHCADIFCGVNQTMTRAERERRALCFQVRAAEGWALL
jgi:hypothetical protein